MSTGHTFKQVEEEVVFMDARKRTGIPADCKEKTSTILIDPESPNHRVTIQWHERITKPGPINEYNMHMGGVDRNAQMRSNYSIKRPTVKFWVNMFEFLIEFAAQNAFRMHHMYFSTADGEPNQFAQKTHKQFIEDLAITLIHRHAGRSRTRYPGDLDEHNQDVPSQHVYEKLPKRRRCYSCAKMRIRRPPGRALQSIDPNIQSKEQQAARSQTRYQCAACKKPVCRGVKDKENQCWQYLHH